ncbi:hypothetical protein EUGRSUZ_B00677 [Eucalyptus grandis]|uniref:Uncharacterized protein n=2 Tax=Eucalyptus grandis TaxID=71139 RepID=A0ACC3LMY4_EUCGR|nr:hypothetical protein EUGRSUZ_B00677 [Eucalyptus grandis]
MKSDKKTFGYFQVHQRSHGSRMSSLGGNPDVFPTKEKMVMQAEAGRILLSRQEAYRYWIHKLFFLSFVEYTDVLR